MSKLSLKTLALFVFILGLAVSQADQVATCGMDCQVLQSTEQNLLDIIDDLLEEGESVVSVVKNEETGIVTVTLSDGSVFSIETIGLMLRHHGMQQRHANQSEDGSLHLRSQNGLEVRIRAAMHQEEEIIGEMYRLGWTDFFWFDGGVRVNSPAGERLCLAPDMQISAGPANGMTTIDFEVDGSLMTTTVGGVKQRLHGCAYDSLQLRDHIQSAAGQQLAFNTRGEFMLEVDGVLMRFRLSSLLRQSGLFDQAGFFTEQNRLFFRYRDGWEQEIITET